MKSEIVRRSIRQTAANSTARQPHRESRGMMIATVSVLDRRCSPKLRAPDNERVLQQTAASQVREQTRNRFVDPGTFLHQPLIVLRVVVPGVVGRNLNVADSLFGKLAGEQALPSEVIGRFLVHAIQFERFLRLLRLGS